ANAYFYYNPLLTPALLGPVYLIRLHSPMSTLFPYTTLFRSYAITVTLGSNPNYSVTTTAGNLHIGPKTATVTADNKAKTYGDDNTRIAPACTPTVYRDSLTSTLSTKTRN